MWPTCATDETGLALLRTAVAHPREETPRLVLADWLQEQGEDEVADTMRRSVQARRWVGFPAGVRDRWRPWNASFGGLPGAVITDSAEAAALPNSPWLTGVQIKRGVTDAGMERLFGTNNWTELHLDECPGVTDTGLSHLTGLAKLTEFLVSGCPGVTDTGLAILQRLPNLTTLGLSECQGVTDTGLVHLAGRTKLTELYLGQLRVTDNGLAHLAGLINLTELWLPGCGEVSDDGLAHLSGLTSLAELDLRETRVTEWGMKELQRALPGCKISR